MKISKRARTAGLAAGVAAFATMAFGAGSAQAAPQAFATGFDNAYLKTVLPGSGADILDPPALATIAGQLRDERRLVRGAAGMRSSGPAVSDRGGFLLPRLRRDGFGNPRRRVAGQYVAINGQLSGGLRRIDGNVTTAPATFVAVITIGNAPNEDVCTIGDPPATPEDETDMVLSFTTASTTFPNPYNGDPFDTPPSGTFPPLRNGAVVANYPSLPGDSGTGRQLLARGRAHRWTGWPLDGAGPDGSVGERAACTAARGAWSGHRQQPNSNKQKTKKKCKKKKKGKKGASTAAKGKNCGKKKKKK